MPPEQLAQLQPVINGLLEHLRELTRDLPAAIEPALTFHPLPEPPLS